MFEDKKIQQNQSSIYLNPPSGALGSVPDRLQPGDLLGNSFKVISFIGAGGMSNVYKCEDLSLGRIVAVKTLQAEHSADTLRRFQTEGKAIAKLEHPNILKLHGLQVTPEGLPILVMEFVPGSTLDTLLSEKGAIPTQRSLRIAAQIGEALKAAEKEGVIHRDLKPSNIMIVNPGAGNESVKILDFGIAKIQGESQANATRTGEVFGTPQYMSPEQVTGKKCDARTDQYAFGCVLFEMLTGTPPYTADNSFAVMMAHLQDPIPSLNKNVTQPVPPHLDAVLNKLLQKSPEHRYNSMNDALNAIFTAQNFPSKLLKNKLLIGGLCLILLASAAIFGFSAKDKHFSIVDNTNSTVTDDHATPASSLKSESKATGVDGKPASVAVQGDKSKTQIFSKTDQYVKDHIEELKRASTLEFNTEKTLGSDVTDAGLIMLADSKALKSLTMQHCNSITSKGLKAFTGGSESKSRTASKNLEDADNNHYLETLDLRYSDINDDAASALSHISTLKDLRLSGTDIGSKTCESLAQLPMLNALWLGSTEINGFSLPYLAKIKTLLDLDLQHDNVSDCIKYLNGLHLRRLNLSGISLTEGDFESILKMSSLETLLLRETNIDDKKLQELAALRNLKRLELDKCKSLTSEGLREFALVKPSCDLITKVKYTIEANQLDQKVTRAGSELVKNGSFELNKTPELYMDYITGSDKIKDWSVSHGTVSLVGNYWSAAEGKNSIELNGSSAGAISQTFNTVPGKTYGVVFSATTNPDRKFDPPYVMQVSAAGLSQDYSLPYPSNRSSDMRWITHYWAFKAAARRTTLQFRSMTEGGCGPCVDQISVKEIHETPKAKAER